MRRTAPWIVALVLVAGTGLSLAEAPEGPAAALRTAVEEYRPEQGRAGRRAASDAFFAFEDSALDQALGARDPALYQQIESEWTELIREMGAGAARGEIERRAEGLLGLLAAADAAASGGSLFADSFLIILREGFEAILVVSALASYLVRSGNAARLGFLYGGAALAIVASLALWGAARTVVTISGVEREALEGWTMLLATGVLFWVSYWLISKAEADRWQAFVRRRIDSALGRGTLVGLTLLSFVVVFREGFETVLFYEALAARADDPTPLVAGFGAGLVALAVAAVLFLRLGHRLPMAPFFAVTGALLYFLAFKFAGAGVFELQVAQVLEQTHVAGFPDAPFLRSWFGIFPYLEPLALQGALVVLAVVALVATLRRPAPASTSARVATGRAL